ncbi:hypothetical protein HPB52_007372 [Rhipicephalus sanguineus]|uniref:Uncharacterized protein n=1 Tax=Rhipicephalus sanguineus TaxID=34632 RepID=A0A9D4SNK8_RHISA|nr:hypothetical protein HPB52_007372 [Rhipicephalus sanguineus]
MYVTKAHGSKDDTLTEPFEEEIKSSFCIRQRLIPPDVRRIFGCLEPSPTHGMRVCKILRAEWQYQARVFRESLYLKLHSTYRPTTATQQFRFFSSMANRTTEFVWQHTLPHLRAMIPRRPATSGNSIHTYGDVVLPEFARDVLGMGPKFAVPPRSSAPELVTYVRQVSRLANDAEADRCVSEGLDV